MPYHIDWDDILDTLDAEQCILFIGQGAYLNENNQDISTMLCAHLDAHNPEHPHIRMYNNDGFFLFRKDRFRRRIVAKMKDFYNQPFPNTENLFAKLAQLPFNMFFSLTPDNILSRTFDKHGFEYSGDFYNKNTNLSEQIELPSKNKPLIYNLLGNIEEPNSIVLTHQNFFDYLKSVFEGNNIHESLKTKLENAERYIFLGLPYEKWYFQLLLRVLSMHSDKLKEVERLALKEFENPQLHQLYTTEFKIEFIPDQIEGFVNNLYTKCKEEGILKQASMQVPSLSQLDILSTNAIKDLIVNGKIKKSLQHLLAFLLHHHADNRKEINPVRVLLTRHKLLEQRHLRGTIRSDDYSVEMAQIVEASLELTTQVQKYE